jgi:uncharacterized LabA/DUF88 family protein
MKRTVVYIDGFNLYYRAVKNTKLKWLDLKKLSKNILSKDHKIEKIKYFTANVSGRDDPQAPLRQQIYLRALEAHIPEFSIHYGQFMSHKVWARLANPTPKAQSIQIIKTEEKGSDVNLAVHLVNDAWMDLYDYALVISNDSDLAEAIRLVREHHPKVIGVAIPHRCFPSKELIDTANFRKRIREGVLKVSQLPNPIPGTKIHKPDSW